MLPPGRCPRCALHAGDCICPAIPSVVPRTRVLVVRHALETWKLSNSTRLAALALPSLRVVEHGLPGAPVDLSALSEPGTWLLWPEGATTTGAPAPPPAQLVVIDGTWAQARRMVQRIAALRGLPRLALPGPRREERLRRAPTTRAMSTIEAIAGALALIEGDAVAAPLEALWAEYVARVRAYSIRRGAPGTRRTKPTFPLMADNDKKAPEVDTDTHGVPFGRVPGPGPKDEGKGAAGQEALERLVPNPPRDKE